MIAKFGEKIVDAFAAIQEILENILRNDDTVSYLNGM